MSNSSSKFTLLVSSTTESTHVENHFDRHYENIQTAVKHAILLEYVRCLNM